MINLEDLPEVKSFLETKKSVTLLRPQKTKAPLPFSVSKMGGTPNLNLFETWPLCSSCGTPLNFVLQIYKNEYPEFYFPEDATVFLLFRCPNFYCDGAFDGHQDLAMFWFYGNADTGENARIEKPACTLEDMEDETPNCLFRPLKSVDYPHYGEFNEKWEEFEMKYSDDADVVDEYMNMYYPRLGTKIDGYPSWMESPDYPVCACGKKKEFFFQLSSEEEEVEEKEPFEWPPYAAELGESCNVYFFVCHQCGPGTIETRWECYL